MYKYFAKSGILCGDKQSSTHARQSIKVKVWIQEGKNKW